VIYGEVARLSQAFFRLKVIGNNWNRLCASSTERLLKKSFLESFKLALHNKASWYTSFKAMLEQFGIEFLECPQPIDGALVCKLRDAFIENFKTTLRQATETSSLKSKTYNLVEVKRVRLTALPEN
jgi:hypothetical protein